MSKRVIYTSIFGGYDKVTEQSSDGWDWKCFSEENSTPFMKIIIEMLKSLRYCHTDIYRTMSIVFL